MADYRLQDDIDKGTDAYIETKKSINDVLGAESVHIFSLFQIFRRGKISEESQSSKGGFRPCIPNHVFFSFPRFHFCLQSELILRLRLRVYCSLLFFFLSSRSSTHTGNRDPGIKKPRLRGIHLEHSQINVLTLNFYSRPLHLDAGRYVCWGYGCYRDSYISLTVTA